MEKLINRYNELRTILKNYYYAIGIMSFDCETDCPKLGKEYSMDVQNFFQEKAIDIETSDEYSNLIDSLYEKKDELDEFLRLQIEKEHISQVKLRSIPRDELTKHFENMSRSSLEWQKARETLDYSKFEKELTELVSYYKKYTGWVPKKGNEPYDILLDECEDDFTTEMYDQFFDNFKKEIVPLVKEILKKEPKYNKKLNDLSFDIDKQKKLTKFICEKMGYTNQNGCLRETIHPFTHGIHANDVRVTTAYKEKELFSNLYSVMHEVGHALYELGQDEKLNGTVLFGGTSCAIHESQSRFYENYLGRSKEFIHFLYPYLKELFESELKDIMEEDIYYYVNSVSNQFTRTEADELTYSLHIIIRYEIEKELFRNEISVLDIDRRFNELFFEFFGVSPKNELEGCYQDVHWTSGFGYFPTYALGNAFAAQFMNKMKDELDINSLMLEGNFRPINEWLDKNIHIYGASKKNLQILKDTCGENFDSHYYIDYLKNKFKTIYEL